MVNSNKPPGMSGIKDTGIVFLTKILGVFGGIATQSCMAWVLAPAGRGELGVCVTFASVMGVIFALGTDRAIQYYLASKRINTVRAVSLTLTCILTSSLVSAICGWLLIHSSLEYFQKASSPLFILSMALIPTIALNTAFILLLSGLKQFKFLGVIGLLQILGNLLLTIVFLVIFKWEVYGAILSLILNNLIFSLAMLVQLLRGEETIFTLPTTENYRFVVGYGLRYYIARLGNILNMSIGLIVLAFMATKIEIGLFALASVLVARVLIIPNSLDAVLMPRIAADKTGRSELISVVVRISFIILFLALGFLCLVAKWLIPFVFSPEFEPAVVLVWIISLGILIKGTAKPMTTYFIGSNRPGIVSFSTGTELITNLGLLPLFYHFYGLAGAAWVATIGNISGSLVLVVMYHLISKQSISKTWIIQLADISILKNFVIKFLGKAPRQKLFYDLHSADQQRKDLDQYQLIFLKDRVIKRQGRECTRVELEKTERALKISESCKLFQVPKILASDISSGSIEFERINDFTQMWYILKNEKNTDNILSNIGRGLAEIHNQLQLPADFKVPLASQWQASKNVHQVFVHGDFNLFNLVYHSPTEQIYIIDWMTSQLYGDQGTYGPCYFDPACFMSSMFFQSHFGFYKLDDIEKKSKIFIDSYLEATNFNTNIDQFRQYLKEFSIALPPATAINNRNRSYLSKITSFRTLRIGKSAYYSYIKKTSGIEEKVT